MNKDIVISKPYIQSETILSSTSSVWAGENIVQAVQESVIPPNQLFLSAESIDQYYSSIGNIDYITINPESKKILIIETKNQQSWKTYGKFHQMPSGTIGNDPSDWFSDNIKISIQEPIEYSVWNDLHPTETTKVTDLNAIAGLMLLKEVIDYSEFRGLSDYLQFAIEAIKNVFGQDIKLTISKDSDPEINEEWINIEIQAEGNVQNIINKYNHVIELWVQHIPWPQRSMIRFSF
jgi:hypothetical protein